MGRLDATSPVSIRDQWARQQAIRGVQERWNHLVRENIPGLVGDPLLLDGDALPPAPIPPPITKTPFFEPEKVINIGIVGAGAGGLFTALVLDYLNKELAKRSVIHGPPGTVIKPCDESCHKPCHKPGHNLGSGSEENSDEGQRYDYDPGQGEDHQSSVYVPRRRKPCKLTFKYHILEAGKPERLGGRLYTHDFGGPRDTHDYYDVGAMRFPDNPVMER